MRYIDFFIQTLLFLCGLACVIAGLVDQSWYMSVLLPQFFLGAWQIMSNLLRLPSNDQYRRMRVVHLVVALIYLVMLIAGPGLSNHLFLTAPAWVLAIAYYTLTCGITFRANRSQGNFLSHINF